MRQATHELSVSTRGKGFYEITDQVREWVGEHRFKTGLLTVFLQHTSASLLIQENADPDVRKDLETFFSGIAPEDANYVHDTEGPDDMPAHIRTALTQTQLSIPIHGGSPVLGAWQGIYVFEHRRGGHRRSVVLHAFGE